MSKKAQERISGPFLMQYIESFMNDNDFIARNPYSL